MEHVINELGIFLEWMDEEDASFLVTLDPDNNDLVTIDPTVEGLIRIMLKKVISEYGYPDGAQGTSKVKSTVPTENKAEIDQMIVDMYNSICVSYPKIRTLSEARKKAIRARKRIHSLDEFRTVFEKAEASDFLKGANNRNWSATFDWMIKDSNFTKILEGNYDNKTSNGNSNKEQVYANFLAKGD